MTARGEEVHPSLGELTARVVGMVDRAEGARVLVGVVGAPGAGKSTLAVPLCASLGAALGDSHAVAVLPMDGFHLADVSLDALGLRDRKGTPETFDGDGYVALLRRVRDERSRPVYAPGFDRVLEQPLAGALRVDPEVRVVITEGNYLLLDQEPWRAVRDLLDEVWFLEVDDATRVARLHARHVEFGKTDAETRAWMDSVDHPNAALVAATRERADLVVHP